MTTMRVAVSGVSSYSGMCIARAFAGSGAVVFGLLSRSRRDYAGLGSMRLRFAEQAGVILVPGCAVETGAMAEWIVGQKLDVWVHHHHPMREFRSPDYDVALASEIALAPLDALARAWALAGVKAVLHSGTYFEPNEGGQPPDARATPYAELKARVGRELVRRAGSMGFDVTKVVISSPTGALENEDRLTPQMLRAAQEGRPFQIRSPESIFDHIPGESLAEVYINAAQTMLRAGAAGQGGNTRTVRPSGWIVSAQEWAEWVRVHLAEPLGLSLDVRYPEPEARPLASDFHNPRSERASIDWDAFAVRYVEAWPARVHFEAV